MFKKICLFIIIFLLFLIIKNNKNETKTLQNQIMINSPEKRILSINCEISLGLFKKILDGDMFIHNENFRIFLYYKSQKKIDIGCNSEYFWYWSKKEDENTLFYSKRSDMDLVLKECYSPSWMFSVFKNLEKIGQKYNLLKDEKILSTAQILSNNIIKYNIIQENITIIFKIKNASIENFNESVFIIPSNEFKNLNKMIPGNSSSK